MKATGRAGGCRAAVAVLAVGWAVGFDVSVGNSPTVGLSYYLPLTGRLPRV